MRLFLPFSIHSLSFSLPLSLSRSSALTQRKAGEKEREYHHSRNVQEMVLSHEINLTKMTSFPDHNCHDYTGLPSLSLSLLSFLPPPLGLKENPSMDIHSWIFIWIFYGYSFAQKENPWKFYFKPAGICCFSLFLSNFCINRATKHPICDC